MPEMPPAIKAVIFVGLPAAGVRLFCSYSRPGLHNSLTCCSLQPRRAFCRSLVWAGVQVAVISQRSGAQSGCHPGMSSVPVGCVHTACQASNVPAALRCAMPITDPATVSGHL